MSDINDKEALKRWVDQWKITGPILEAERRKRIQECKTETFIQNTVGMVDAYLKKNGFRNSTGLVEQQRLFRTLKHARTG